jgi:SET domain-containing protein
MYKPLPNFLTIKKSPIHGIGLFALEDISKGTDLGRSHFVSLDEFIRTPLGGFVNHSDNPNVRIKREKGTRFFHLFVINDIKAGTELTAKYNYKAKNYR